MESRPYRILKQTLMFLWLSANFTDICGRKPLLEDLPTSVFREENGNMSSCFEKILSYFGNETTCWQIYYPKVKTAVQNNSVCFTTVANDAFHMKGDTNNISFTNYNISQRKEVKNEGNISCEWLQSGFKNFTNDQGLFVARLNYIEMRNKAKEPLCVILAVTRNSSKVGGLIRENCLHEFGDESSNSTTPRIATTSKRKSILDYLKTYIIPILAGVAGALFITVLIVTIRAHWKRRTPRHQTSEIEQHSVDSVESMNREPQHSVDSVESMNCEPQHDNNVYHEPNFDTYMDMGGSTQSQPKNYEYAYSHVEPSRRSYVVCTQEPGKRKRNYENITEFPNRDQQGYIEIDEENGYTSLDRSDMTSESSHYQALVRRPKPAPRTNLQRVEQPTVSYVKVI